MQQAVPRISATLGRPPLVRHAGVNTHGEPHRVERYSHLKTWCVHLYRYDGELCVDGRCYEIRPGRATFLPPNAVLEYRYRGRSTHACVHFAFADGPMAMSGGAAAVVSVPLVQDLGPAFAAANAQLEQVIAWHAVNPARAAVRLWDLLWQLADDAADDARAAADVVGGVHPAVRHALEQIELRLAGPLYVTELAQAAGVSHNHLTRLFRAATGGTVAAHIARRRAQRAEHLLRHTTLPVKVVASQVGVPDLHQFNKLVRRTFGASPRGLRRG